MKRWIWLCLLLLSLAACSNNDAVRTLEANHALAGSQVAELRVTATVQAARARTTVDFVETRAALAATQSNFLESTLVATGVSRDAISTQRQVILGSSPTPQASPNIAENSSEIVAPLASPSPESLNVIFVTPTQIPSPSPSPDANSLRVEPAYTAEGAGSNGCGEGITSVFDSNTSEIYVIARAYNIEANTVTFAARWTRDGQAVGPVYDFTPDYDATELCIWFFVDPSDFEFLPATYTVVMDVNGVPSSNPVSFIIEEQP